MFRQKCGSVYAQVLLPTAYCLKLFSSSLACTLCCRISSCSTYHLCW